MLKRTTLAAYPSSTLWNRTRVQLGGGLLFAAILPVVLLLLISPHLAGQPVASLTAAGIAGALVLSFYLLRNISVFPGIRRAYFILPSVLIGYGVVFALFLMFRLDYSRSVLAGSMAASLIWFYAANVLVQRLGDFSIGVIPFGDVASLTEVHGVDWTWLTKPSIGNTEYKALVADFRADLPDEWEAFMAESALTGLPIFHVKQLRESLTGQVEIEHISENNFGSLIPFIGYLRIRRAIDFAAALVVGAVLLPFLLVIAALVRLDSPGPALFRQNRMGYRGRSFSMIKFRTMVHARGDCDARDDAMTIHNDARVTRLGRFLRRSRIDELPQIINILRGEMSWIGPRPEAEVLSNWYQSELPFYRYRHIVPPGITGWAQVNQGHVAELDQVNAKLHYDFYYIKNFSPWLDALILFKTVRTILTGFGSR